MDFPLLTSSVILLPALGALLTLFLRSVSSIRWTALITTTLTFVLSVGLFLGYDPSVSTAVTPQLADVSSSWFPESLDIKYFVGIDGLSLMLVMLTTLLGPTVVLSSWTYIAEKQKGYYALLLLLQTGITGVFTSFDLFLFYIFFELTLIPMYFIIGIWGGTDRIYAAVKFVIYTLVGSLLMLVGILYLGFEAGAAVNNGVFTTDWYKLLEYNVPLAQQGWLFAIFTFSFAIKVPLFPLHTWLPDAHVQAPTGGSVVLAGVLLKMGTYGLLRFCLPLFPNAAQDGALLIAILAVIGIIYGALVARVQEDAKGLVAYSSVSHLGFVVLGLFAFTPEALQGAVIQMVNHGLSTGALFLLLGMLYERRHTRMMEDYGGLAGSVPVLSTLMVFSVLASAGLPGLNGFVGEFMILLGSFKSTVLDTPGLVVLATIGVILAAVYLLHMVYRTFFGELTIEANAEMADVNGREFLLMAPLVVLMLVLGFFPNPFLRQTKPTTDFLLDKIESKKAAAIEQAESREKTARVPVAPPEAEEVTVDVGALSIDR
ncbi:MAG: Fe-S-binding domain-containing protein [Bacteroidetes bacterium SW_9_63_38]|nr:MAG: Fe-S-binding domain-containing protein [Bacteroidetes bacterium SW_9_63_38]